LLVKLSVAERERFSMVVAIMSEIALLAHPINIPYKPSCSIAKRTAS
jgi:hypothetical protein